jgi:glutamate N-acetyltransferase/amino-acid N-acetyltransferase
MAKGSGMIHPNMGTMLSFITTDADIDSILLNELLKDVINDTYNMISVDGDTSTNDMVLVLANGMSGCGKIEKGTQAYEIFKEAFYKLNEALSILIIKDGEGATKFIEVVVEEMTTKEEARKMVHAVITSNLVKTAFFGEDANWGRILCALGYSGAMFDPNKVNVKYISDAGEIQLLNHGQPVLFDEAYALEILKEKEIKVLVSCDQGLASAKGWGCDLSYDYVKINGEYRT